MAAAIDVYMYIIMDRLAQQRLGAPLLSVPGITLRQCALPAAGAG
jgi:hypothetical protein